VLKLSPAELRDLAMTCRVYLVLTAYVRHDRVLLRALRAIESLGGRVIHIDEESRRIVGVIPARSMEEVAGFISEYASGYTINVKASCQLESLACVEERLKALGRRVRGGPHTLYVTVNGRVVEVNFRGGGRVDVKIGSRGSLTTPIPPSVFNLTLDDAIAALGDLRAALEALGLEVCRGG